jgi:PAS domain-containing protein
MFSPTLQQQLRASFGTDDLRDLEGVLTYVGKAAASGSLPGGFRLRFRRLLELIDAQYRQTEAARETHWMPDAFRGLAERQFEGLWALDAQLRFIAPAGCDASRVFGPPGLHPWDLPGFSAKQGGRLRRMLQAGRAVRDLELPGTCGNRIGLSPGRTVRLSGEAVFDAEGRFSGYRGLVCGPVLRAAVAGPGALERVLSVGAAEILAETGQGLFVIEVQTRSLLMSDTAWRMLGYQPGELPCSLETLRALTHPEDITALDDLRGALLGGVQASAAAQIRRRHKDEGYRRILIRARAEGRSPEGVPDRIVGLISEAPDPRGLGPPEAPADAEPVVEEAVR